MGTGTVEWNEKWKSKTRNFTLPSFMKAHKINNNILLSKILGMGQGQPVKCTVYTAGHSNCGIGCGELEGRGVQNCS